MSGKGAKSKRCSTSPGPQRTEWGGVVHSVNAKKTFWYSKGACHRPLNLASPNLASNGEEKVRTKGKGGAKKQKKVRLLGMKQRKWR